MDTIAIQDLRVSTKIGVPDSEREHEQELKVSVWFTTDTRAAAKSDNIEDTIDYAEVGLRIQQLGNTERKTVERFAEDIANMILNTFSTAEVSVSIDKFALPDANKVTVTINRP